MNVFFALFFILNFIIIHYLNFNHITSIFKSYPIYLFMGYEFLPK